MRNLVCAGIAAVGLMISGAAHADTLYSLTLTPTTGATTTGTGSFSLSSAPSATGVNTFYAAGGPAGAGTIDALSFILDGETFNLSNDTGTPLIQFTNGTLSDITFSSTVLDFSVNDIYSLQVAGLSYSFGDVAHGQNDETGNIAATAMSATAVTPEPSSLLLIGTGLMAGIATMRRRLA